MLLVALGLAGFFVTVSYAMTVRLNSVELTRESQQLQRIHKAQSVLEKAP
jgi:hypothetical protein